MKIAPPILAAYLADLASGVAVSRKSIAQVAVAGVDISVAGPAIYGAADPVALIGGLRRLAQEVLV